MNKDHDYPEDDYEQTIDTTMVSLCCGAGKLSDTDICSRCGEHSEFEKDTE